MQIKIGILTDHVHGGFTVAEAPGGPIVKIDPVGQVVSSGEGRELVVVAIVNQRVPEDEVTWDLRICSCQVGQDQERHHVAEQSPPSSDRQAHHAMNEELQGNKSDGSFERERDGLVVLYHGRTNSTYMGMGVEEL